MKKPPVLTVCLAAPLLLAVGMLTAPVPGQARAAGDSETAIAGRTFYVDSEAGQDDHDGRTPERAWRSLSRVNAAELAPGDTVRFRRGGLWRGSLIPVSGRQGAPVTYSSYGEGPKPRLLGSVPRNRLEDWVQIRDNLWATLPQDFQPGPEILDLRDSRWTRHQEAGARVELQHAEGPAGTFVQLMCHESGTAGNHVQLWGPELALEQGDWLLLTFRARSTQPFQFPGIDILASRAPWTRYARSGPTTEKVQASWQTFSLAFQVEQTAPAARLHINLGGMLPPGAVFEFQPLRLQAATPRIPDPLCVDVGNIIFDQGTVCGWKKWSRDELARPYDYYYEPARGRVYLVSEQAPPLQHASIELALARHVVNQSDRQHLVFDGLAILYGAAHGFGGGNTRHIVIRNCELAYIGGAHQFTRPDGRPVRYGNAIEFWNAARDHLVEDCRIWEVYDAALTNQGRGPDSQQINITYRNNLIWNAEYSFEYWNHPETAVTRNIRFINNTCIGAGRGWAHEQRPDPNGSHLMFYSNTAETSGIQIRDNIFYDHTDWGSRYTGGWEVLPELDANVWYSQQGIMASWFRDKLASFDQYRELTGLEAHSVFTDPGFVDPANGDYRVASDSPLRELRPDGEPVGAAWLWCDRQDCQEARAR